MPPGCCQDAAIVFADAASTFFAAARRIERHVYDEGSAAFAGAHIHTNAD
jgi:hypothetical protein